MTDAPLVTVGIPAYNRADCLREALDSLIAQSYRNIEILVSDDVSTDQTPLVCQEYAQKDPRIKCIRQSHNLGIAANHNYLLEKAKGKYFVWACDDDMRHRDFVKSLAELLSDHPDAAGAMCGVSHIVDGGHRAVNGPMPCSNDSSPYQYLMNYARTGDYSPIGGMFVTSELRQAGGYHADSRPFFRASDYLTILRLGIQGKVVHTREVLFFKRDTGAAHRAFEVLSSLQFDRDTRYRILRYACFPLFYIYNLIFGIHFVAESGLLLRQKARIIASLLGYYLRSNLEFAWNIVHGLWAVLAGCAIKLWRRSGKIHQNREQ